MKRNQKITQMYLFINLPKRPWGTFRQVYVKTSRNLRKSEHEIFAKNRPPRMHPRASETSKQAWTEAFKIQTIWRKLGKSGPISCILVPIKKLQGSGGAAPRSQRFDPKYNAILNEFLHQKWTVSYQIQRFTCLPGQTPVTRRARGKAWPNNVLQGMFCSAALLPICIQNLLGKNCEAGAPPTLDTPLLWRVYFS